MISNDDSSLPPLTQEALDALTTTIPDGESFSKEQAYTILCDELDLNQPAATDIFDRLHMRGHLYAVDDEFRLTDT